MLPKDFDFSVVDQPMGYKVRLWVETVDEYVNGVYTLNEVRDVANCAVGYGVIIAMGESAFLDPDEYGPRAREFRPKIGDIVNHRKMAGLTYRYESGTYEKEVNDRDCFSIRNSKRTDKLVRVF